MSRILTTQDQRLSRQHVLNLKIKLDVYDNDENYLDSIECGIVSGTCNIDSTAAVRRTMSFVLVPHKKVNTLIEEDSLIWINRYIVMYIGIEDMRTHEYVWYRQGNYMIQTYDSTYDATTNQLTINCSDWMSRLDGTRNGQLGAQITSFPAYKEYVKDVDDIVVLDNVSYNENTYRGTANEKYSYKTGNYIVFKATNTNSGNDKIQVNNLGTLSIIDHATGQRVKQGAIQRDYYYSVSITNSTMATLTTVVPVDSLVEGTPLSHFIIRDGVITALTRLGGIKDYNVDDIGEYYAMPDYNDEFEQYRIENPLWNNIPYDIEFSTGDNVLSILTTFRDLYPNYEMFFDEYGTFVMRMIPSTLDDVIYLDNDYLQSILISENFSIDVTTIKNVTEVWGANLETDFTAESCQLSDETYTINVKEYGEKYCNGDKIAIAFDKTNPEPVNVRIHTTYTEPTADGKKTEEKEAILDAIPLIDQMTDLPIDEGVIEAGLTYVCKVTSKVKNGKPTFCLYLLSQYQPQAMNILTDGTVSEEQYTCSNGTIVNKYSMEYFQDFYNCRTVSMSVDVFSPFTIQKLGVVLGVYSGDQFDNIESDQRALARAEYENWKTTVLNDSITLTTKICPWIDVNKKVEYKRSDTDEPEQYLIQSVSHDIAGGTSSIVLSRFRSLYADETSYGVGHTYAQLAKKKHKTLAKYKYKNLARKTTER